MSLKIYSTVNVYVLKGNKLLLNRRANTGWMDGKLCAVGGHVEEGETPTQAMVREIEEELGVSVDPSDLEYLSAVAKVSSTEESVGFEFVIRDKDYMFKNNEPERCSEIVWVELNNLPDDIIPVFREIIEQCLLGNKQYLELGY